MELVIFTGLQASGKSTFYVEQFFHTHVRINLDMLRTRRREWALVRACLDEGQRLVIDNTNPTPGDRARYVGPAKAAHFRVVSYYFWPEVAECRQRNAARASEQQVPATAIAATSRKLTAPDDDEGLDERWVVYAEGGGFRTTPAA